MVPLDERLDQLPALFQPLERAMLVRPHESAIPDDIGAEDRRELTFDGVNQRRARRGKDVVAALIACRRTLLHPRRLAAYSGSYRPAYPNRSTHGCTSGRIGLRCRSYRFHCPPDA